MAGEDPLTRDIPENMSTLCQCLLPALNTGHSGFPVQHGACPSVTLRLMAPLQGNALQWNGLYNLEHLVLLSATMGFLWLGVGDLGQWIPGMQ